MTARDFVLPSALVSLPARTIRLAEVERVAREWAAAWRKDAWTAVREGRVADSMRSGRVPWRNLPKPWCSPPWRDRDDPDV